MYESDAFGIKTSSSTQMSECLWGKCCSHGSISGLRTYAFYVFVVKKYRKAFMPPSLQRITRNNKVKLRLQNTYRNIMFAFYVFEMSVELGWSHP